MSLKRLQKIQLNILDKVDQVEKLIGKEGDNLTRGLEVQLLNNNIVVDDISTIDCVLIAKQKGAQTEDTFVVPGAKVDGKYEIIYPSNLMKKGIVEAELRFTQGEQILTSFIFEIDMARTLVVEEITDSIYEQRLIDVIVDVVANEEQRIKAENKRESSEIIRKANEEDRIALYELIQQKLSDGELNGKNLEFDWNGTQLGVKLEGEEKYQYVNLKGAKGDKGDIEDLTKKHVEDAIGFTPAKKTELENLEKKHTDISNEVKLARGDYNTLDDRFNNLKSSVFLNVEDFGAKGDGSTDDSKSIQEALDYAENSGGGYVYIPAGYYIVGSRLEIASNVHLFGAGRSTLLDGVSSSSLPNGTTGLIINKGYDSSADYAGASHFSIRNLCITSSDEERQGIYLEGATDYYISDITTTGTCKDHWFDINNTKNGVFERLWLNKPNSSIFQIDVRINQTKKGPGNDGLIIRDVFMEDTTDQSNYENNNFRQSGFHFHRGSCKNIYISNVVSRNVHTVFYKDKGIDVENLSVRDVKIDGVYHTFFFEHGTSEPSDSYKDLIIENFDVTSDSAGRGIGWFGAIRNLKVANFKLHTNKLLSDQNGFISFGVNSDNISLSGLELSGEAFDNDTNTPLWKRKYFTGFMQEAIFKSLKDRLEYTFTPKIDGVNSGYDSQLGKMVFENGNINLNIQIKHPNVKTSKTYISTIGYPDIFIDSNYSRFMGILGWMSSSDLLDTTTILTPYLRDVDEGILLRGDYSSFVNGRDIDNSKLEYNITIDIQGKRWR